MFPRNGADFASGWKVEGNLAAPLTAAAAVSKLGNTRSGAQFPG
jgi:hypothetical protein